MSVNSLGYLSGLTTDFTNVRAMGDFAVDGVLTVQNFSANSLIGMLSANTVNAESGNTISIGGNVVARSIDSGGLVFDVRAYGLVDSLATDDSFATINMTSIRTLLSAISTTRGATVYIPSTGSGRAYMFGPAPSTTSAVIPLPPYANLQIDGLIKRTTAAQGRFIGLSFQNRVFGAGVVDGNSTLSAARAGGTNLIMGPCAEFAAPSGETAGHWRISGLRWIRPAHFAMNLRGDNIWVRENDVDSTWGTVKAASEAGNDILSGVNNDGIHILNGSNVWIENNSIQAVDDCIAWTATNAVSSGSVFENINILNNYCRNRKSQFTAASGLGLSGEAGTFSKFAGGGVRVAEESGLGSGLTVSRVRIEGNTLRGGTYGVVMRDLDITGVRIRGNEFVNIMADSTASSDYSFLAGVGRTGAVFCSGGDDVTIEDNTFDQSGIPFVRVLVSSTKSSTKYRIRNNWMRGLDTSLCNLPITTTIQRVGVEIANTHATNGLDDVIVEDNIGDDIDGGFIYLGRESTGDVNNIRVRRNRCANVNTTTQTDARSAAYSLKNGAQSSGITVSENRDNKVLNYTLTGTTNATESFCETVESQSVLVDIYEWTPEMLGSGKMFSAVNGSGTMTAAVTAEGTLYCSGTAANDEVRTGLFSASPWIGRVMEITANLYIISGSVAVHNGQRSVVLAADATDRWKRHRVTLSADETTGVRVRFVCSGGAAEFFVGRLEAVLSNA